MDVTTNKIQFFLEEIKAVRSQVNNTRVKTLTDALGKFENQVTLDQLEQCFKQGSDQLSEHLTNLLHERWQRIKKSVMCYTQQPKNPTNQLCMSVANLLAPIDTRYEIPNLYGPYFILMPSLVCGYDYAHQNIHDFQLHEFILSDDEKLFIALDPCFEFAAVTDAGALQQMVSETDHYPRLTTNEIHRITHHSQLAMDYYQTIEEVNKNRLFGIDLGTELKRLTTSLRIGGAHGGHDGRNYNAGNQANIGIVEFFSYWDKLPIKQKTKLFKLYKDLKDIIGRLARPDSVDYKEVRFCVEMIANRIDPIICEFNKSKDKLNACKKKLDEKKAIFLSSIQSDDYPMLQQYTNSPKVIAFLFEQHNYKHHDIIKHTHYDSAILYALEYEPHALNKIIGYFDHHAKLQAKSFRFYDDNTALIMAAMHGASDALPILLGLGADINATNIHGNTALHEAVINGHVEATSVLLNYQLKINHRNNAQLNCLELAIQSQPQLIHSLIFKMTDLTLEEQKESLHLIPRGKFVNVLFFSLDYIPNIFNSLLKKILSEYDDIKVHALLSSKNSYGESLLINAAKLGCTEAISTLIQQSKHYIHEHDNHCNTALHWAAAKGHQVVVDILIKNQISINSVNHHNQTALHHAVLNKHLDIVKTLLSNKANLSIRNNVDGENALDIAIKKSPAIVEPLILHAIHLNNHTQTKLLEHYDEGRYENLLIFSAMHHPNLLNQLLDLSKKPPHYLQKKQNEMDAFFKFDPLLNIIKTQAQKIRKKAYSDPNYDKANQTIKKLIEQLELAQWTFLLSEENLNNRKKEFKYNCLKAIQDSRYVLEHHRGWKLILAYLLAAIQKIPLPAIFQPLHKPGFFSIKTASHQVLDTVENAINQLN